VIDDLAFKGGHHTYFRTVDKTAIATRAGATEKAAFRLLGSILGTQGLVDFLKTFHPKGRFKAREGDRRPVIKKQGLEILKRHNGP